MDTKVALTSMKTHPDKIDWDAGSKAGGVEAPAGPAYPYGLTVDLNNESLEKLGITEKLPDVGASMVLMATVSVTSVTDEAIETEGAKRLRSVRLQITEMALMTEKAAKPKDTETVLYDGPQAAG